MAQALAYTWALRHQSQIAVRSGMAPVSIYSQLLVDVDGVAPWLGRRSLAGGLSLICA